MHSPAPARVRFSFKASHRRMSLRVSHAGAAEAVRPTTPSLARTATREQYIAPPKRR